MIDAKRTTRRKDVNMFRNFTEFMQNKIKMYKTKQKGRKQISPNSFNAKNSKK
jgi:hypothetical protein